MKRVAIVGTGISAMSVLEVLKKVKNIDITIFESGNLNKTKNLQNKFNFKKSFKYSSEQFKTAKKKFIENYNIKEKNFFLSNVNCLGGLSNFWGGGIEIPRDKFLKDNKLSLKLLSEIKIIKKLFNLNSQIIGNFKNLRKNPYYKIIDELKQKNFNIEDIDISLKGNNTHNTKENFKKIKNKKNIKLLLNHHVERIFKKNNTYEIEVKINNKLSAMKNKFDLIILCAGTIGSTLIVSKFLNMQKIKIKFYNNPMMQICYYNPRLYFQKADEFTFSHPLKNFHQKIKLYENKGSLIPLKFFSNYYLGYSKKNIFLNFIKKGMIAGNIFFDSKLTSNFIQIKGNKNFIVFRNEINKSNILKDTKKKFSEIFKKLNFYPVPFLNFKTFLTGSDAHYTSSLFQLWFNKKKIINKNCELTTSKNFYILDGSVIPKGTFYPSFLISLNAYYQAKKIFKNAKIK